MAANESTRVHEDRALRDLRLASPLSLRSKDTVKLFVPDPAPGLWQRLAGLEAALRGGDTLHPPLGSFRSALRVEDIVDLVGGVGLAATGRLLLEVVQVLLPGNTALGQDDDAPGRVRLGTRVVRGADGGARGEPGEAGVLQLAEEDVADEAAGAREEAVLILRLTGRGGRVREVHVPDKRAQLDTAIPEAFLQTGRGDGRRVVDGDAIVVGVNGLDEVRVELLVQQAYVLMVSREGDVLRDDVPPEVHVDQARGGEPGVVVGEGGREGALVVVEAVFSGVILPAHVDNGVACCQDSRISGTD